VAALKLVQNAKLQKNRPDRKNNLDTVSLQSSCQWPFPICGISMIAEEDSGRNLQSLKKIVQFDTNLSNFTATIWPFHVSETKSVL